MAECPGKATIKAHIGSLRKQLAAVGAKDVIETIYGQGYRLNPVFLETCDRTQQSSAQLSAQPAAVTQTVIEETWEQVQSMAWHRFTRLEALVHDQLLAEPAHETCKMAVAIAHQLKGTLGSFGFQTASLQAKHIEALLSASSLEDNVAVTLLQQQIDTLKQLLQQHITPHGPDLPPATIAGLPSLEPARVLMVARDQPWAEDLVHHGQDGPFQIEMCSPLTINDHLLEHTPDVILLELSQTERSVDLSLLDVLVSNYGEQVPILVVLASLCPDEQLVVIHHGASAVVVKSWATQTLLAMIAEYIPLAPSVANGSK